MLQGDKKGRALGVTSVRLALSAIVITLVAPLAASAYSTTSLRESDVRKAERIIAKLRGLEEVTARAADFRAYKAEIKNFYPKLFVDVSELRESDLRTDLTTAVFLYESAYRDWFKLSARETDCGGEAREIYLKLCHEAQDGDPVRLLWSKARLHTKWGEAVVSSYRGANGAETLAALSEMKAERKADIVLAGQALAALKQLAGRAGAFTSGEAFEEVMRANGLSFTLLSREVSEALSTVERALASLPRGRLHLLLHNACSSYRDGLFWWGKTYRFQERVVSVNNLSAPDPLKAVGLSAGSVNNAVLANWRNALRYTAEAEEAVSALVK